MMISIIIPTLNAAEILPGLLKKLQDQTISEKEIIVIDSSSTDNTIETAESFGAKTISIPREQFDHGGTRNIGAKEAKGDVLVFMTQDAIPADNHCLENLIKPLHEHKDMAASYGRQLPDADASPFSAHLRLFNYPETSHIRSLSDKNTFGFKTIFISNSFSAYNRSALEGIGWFKEDLIFGEDTHAAATFLKRGYRIAYAADARVSHSHNYRALEEFKRYFDIGVFHRTEDWLVREFGQTAGAGIQYIRSGLSYLAEKRKYLLVPSFILRNLLKYAGYNLGLRYTLLSRRLTQRISMNTAWWEKAHRSERR